jgi:hypothetical protein
MANPRLLKTDGTETPLKVTSGEFDIARHNAVITVEHDGDHRTFMIRTIMPGERIASLLTGPDRDNPRNWDNFGFVAPGGVINVFRNRRGDDGKRSPHEWYALMLMNPARFEAKGYEYMLMAFCHRCNRPLTHPESIRTGLGPVCGGRAA